MNLLVDACAGVKLAICEDVLLRHEDALRRGALITAEIHRIRIREFQP